MTLREAAQQALDALRVWQHSLTDPSAIPEWRFSVVGERAITALRTALAKPMSHEFAGVKIKEIRIPENMSMRFDGDVLVIERAHGIGGEE